MRIKLPYGMRNGTLVHISELSKQESGLNCNCTCPHCGSKLLAKIGEIKIPHFAHYKTTDCEYAVETSLTKLAQEILSEIKTIKLPKAELKYSEDYRDLSDFNSRFTEPTHKEVISVEQNYNINKTLLEKKTSNRVDDLIVYIDNIPYIVFITVNRHIDTTRISKIKNMNCPAIMIDLSDKFEDNRNLTREEFKDLLLKEVQSKKWIFNPQLEKRKQDIIFENIQNKRKPEPKSSPKPRPNFLTGLNIPNQNTQSKNTLSFNERLKVHDGVPTKKTNEQLKKEALLSKQNNPKGPWLDSEENRWGTCELCGEFTYDWTTFSGLTNTCKCRKCNTK